MNPLESIERANNHFAVFNLPAQFDLDEAALQSRYLELTRLTHPDFAGDDIDSQMRAMELSARVNEAHRILSDPETRANYLLMLQGGPAQTQDTSLPDGFLEEIMLLREELADAQSQGNAQSLQHLEAQARQRRQSHLTRIAELFQQPTPQAASQIRTELNALRYIQRMLEQIHATGR